MITPAKGDDEREQVDDGYCHVRQGVTVCTCASTGYGAGMENVRILLDFLGGASFDKGRRIFTICPFSNRLFNE